MTTAYAVLSGKPGKDFFADLEVDGRMILQCTLNKYGFR
jgi:hypothetical protein